MKRFLLGSAVVIALAVGLLAHTAHPFRNCWTLRDDGREVPENAGYVLWSDGPGWETRGTVGFIAESSC